MENYKELYTLLFNRIEDTINSLIQAQRDAEEMYLNAVDGENK